MHPFRASASWASVCALALATAQTACSSVGDDLFSQADRASDAGATSSAGANAGSSGSNATVGGGSTAAGAGSGTASAGGAGPESFAGAGNVAGGSAGSASAGDTGVAGASAAAGTGGEPTLPGLLLSTTQPLTIQEGSSSSFTLTATQPPRSPWRVAVMSSTPSISVSPASIDFNAQNWQTPVTVRVNVAVDNNQVNEQATVSLSAPGLPAMIVPVIVQDTTQLVSYGFPAPAFPGTATFLPTSVVAYQVTIPALTVHALGALPKASGNLRMALYRDLNGQPGALVSGAATLAVKNGEISFDLPDSDLAAGVYWVALRVDAPLAFNASPAPDTATACVRTAPVADIHHAWPTTFGPATCSASAAVNVWLTAYQN